jgi:hypothetical protein
VIELLQGKDYQYLLPERLDPDVIDSLRTGYGYVILNDHLQQALVQINPKLPISCIQQAIKEVERVNTHGDLVACNVSPRPIPYCWDEFDLISL